MTTFILILSCSNDNDAPQETITSEEPVTKSDLEVIENNQRTRTVSFSAINDVNLIDGKAIDNSLITLAENKSIGYLMFDLRPILEINGSIIKTDLELALDSEVISGDISIYQGKEVQWDEKNITYETAPENSYQIGSTFRLNNIVPNEYVSFELGQLSSEKLTLILDYKNGGNISFLSKDHPSHKKPKLVVTYLIPENSDKLKLTEFIANNSNSEKVARVPSLDISLTKIIPIDKKDFLPASNPQSEMSNQNDYNETKKQLKLNGIEDTSFKEKATFSNTTQSTSKTENQAPIAVITAHKTTGTAPFRVWFTGDKSTDNNAVVGYLWKFKDGRQNATIKNPAHTFERPGTYVVELTVTNQNGITNTKSITITATKGATANNKAPVAVITADKISGQAPIRVYFKGDKSTDDKIISSYLWKFKDGRQNATIKNPAHTFEKPGTYNVELTVKDNEGLSNTKIVKITATNSSNQAPVAVVTADKTTGNAPIRVKLQGSNSTDDKGVTGYLWKFKDGRQNATIPNPIHTFEKPGTYPVELTVTDAQGLSNTKTINIVATTSIINNPPGYYVTVNGSANNDGQSEASSWSITHAFQNAKAGDVVYIKAGNYGNVKLQPGYSGTSSNPIRFIGYQNTPGDIVANSGSTFQYGDVLDAKKMPLITGNRLNNIGQGSGIYNFHKHIQISNIQITHYAEGVFSSGDYTVLDNIIVTEIGDFNPAHTYPTRTPNPSLNYSGVGIKLKGDYSTIKNCFVLNAGAEGYHFSQCRYQTHSYNKAYSDSSVNPCDYYYLLSIDAQNNDLSNIYVERVGDLEHLGHGLVLKFSARNNIIRNSHVKNTWLELSYSKVADNTFTNCIVEGGTQNQGALIIANGANSNTFNQCRVTRCDGVAFSDWDEDFSRGDVRDAGHHNTFKQCTFDNNLAGIYFFWYSQENKQYSAHDNTFDGCTFRNMDNLFLVDRANSNNLLKNCTIQNITRLRDSFLPTLHSGIPLNAIYQNNTVINCGFENL
ncbi:PKD domain-containing protein [uncultured Zobellia sp.]|uniref:PKD domain-containing protein n=1 Tax=uncultured Zobellia sp. TaxID=255433 RepID=UPI002597F2AE|nr:PKD domain-containing protein [uncultured Zobellia sp.]